VIGQAGEAILIDALVRAGPFALVLIALGIGWLYTKGHVVDLRDQIVELRKELKETRDALARSNEVSRDVLLPVAHQTLTAINTFNEELLWRRRQAS
jgi:hypothetical protein